MSQEFERITIAEALHRAALLYERRQWGDAENWCGMILATRANHFGALYLLGMIALQSGRTEDAARLLQHALSNGPGDAAAYNNYGTALEALGRLDEAVHKYDQAISLNPSYAVALYNRGNALLALNRFEAALESYDRALELQPDYPEAHTNRGNLLLAQRHFTAALECYERALAISPDFAPAHLGLGTALHELQRFAEALESHERALKVAPQDAEAYNGQGVALAQLNRPESALRSFDQAIALRPQFADAFYNRGNVLVELYRAAGPDGLQFLNQAIASFGEAIANSSKHVLALNNRGNVYRILRRSNEALADFDRAIELNPHYAEAYSNRGVVLQESNQLDAAIASYDRAIALDSQYAQAYLNRSMARLLRGELELGWVDYEWRHKTKNGQDLAAGRDFDQPQWLGTEPLDGKTILLHCEQGFGDTLQFCRYTQLLAGLGAKVILQVPEPLHGLLVALEGTTQVLRAGDALPGFDFHSSLLSLPLALRTTLSTIPAQIPYIRVSEAKRRSWQQNLGESDRLRVGLVWSGGFRPNQPDVWEVNKRRNIPLAALGAIWRPDCDFYSLQKGQPAEAELAEWSARVGDVMPIADLAPLLHDFSDTGAAIKALDLVIAVDTSIVHLAGALGKPVWLLNRFDTCWRWLLDRSDSPWYPTVTVYRQERPGDWSSVVLRVRRDLEQLVARKAKERQSRVLRQLVS